MSRKWRGRALVFGEEMGLALILEDELDLTVVFLGGVANEVEGVSVPGYVVSQVVVLRRHNNCFILSFLARMMEPYLLKVVDVITIRVVIVV